MTKKAQLYFAVREQSAAWASLPIVSTFTAELPRNASQKSSGLPGTLQEAQASISFVGSEPMRLATNLRAALSGAPGRIRFEDFRSTYGDWYEIAHRIEAAHRTSVAWLRAQLPGFPLLRVPQLARNTAYTTEEFTRRLVWTKQDRAAGLQFAGPPKSISQALRATEAEQRQLDSKIIAVLSSFQATDEWVTFCEASSSLDQNTIDHLSMAIRRIRARLSADALDEYEPNLVRRRSEYRESVVTEEVDSLSGAAGIYGESFREVDELIESVASDVFAQLTCFPMETISCQGIDVEPSAPPRVTFEVSDDTFPTVGQLAWLDDPLVLDAVQVREIGFQWDETGSGSISVGASVLEGSGGAWRG
jgi:hypothetical protein